jgi:hypothetical protein
MSSLSQDTLEPGPGGAPIDDRKFVKYLLVSRHAPVLRYVYHRTLYVPTCNFVRFGHFDEMAIADSSI